MYKDNKGSLRLIHTIKFETKSLDKEIKLKITSIIYRLYNIRQS